MYKLIFDLHPSIIKTTMTYLILLYIYNRIQNSISLKKYSAYFYIALSNASHFWNSSNS